MAGKHIEVRPVRPIDDWVRAGSPENTAPKDPNPSFLQSLPLRPATEPKAEPTKRLTIDIPLPMHTSLKVECAANRRQIADVVRDLIAAHLKRSP
jgi:hypothetical protein